MLTPDALHALRTSRGWSQERLAAEISALGSPDAQPVHRISIVRWESGANPIPGAIAGAVRYLADPAP